MQPRSGFLLLRLVSGGVSAGNLPGAVLRFREHFPKAGFIWLGFPAKEMPAAQQFVQQWPASERQSLLLLGNVTHDRFLTLLNRSYIFCIPACDGVCGVGAGVAHNGYSGSGQRKRRCPPGTVAENDAADLYHKLVYVVEHYADVKARIGKARIGPKLGLTSAR